MSNPEPNLPALLKLLSDDHPQIVEAARTKLVELSDQAVPLLEEAARTHEEPKVRVEAQGVLERIRLVSISRQWQECAHLSDEKIDLEKTAFLLARVTYPDLDLALYQRRLDELADSVRPRIKPVGRPQESIAIFNRFLFEDECFRGNWADYFDPQNSYLNRVLDRKLGIPISLSVLYLLVARRLKLPIQGVGIPGHFMVKYQDKETELFIDVFNSGRFLSRAECIQSIVEAGYPYQKEFLEGVGAREILARMLRNLILIYVERQEETLEKTLTRLLEVLYPEHASSGQGPIQGEVG